MEERQRSFYKISEAAARLGVHVNTGRNWIEEGRLDAIRPGPRTVRIPREEVERLEAPVDSGDFAA